MKDRSERKETSRKEMSLSTFPQAWAGILEKALDSPFELEFPDRPTAKKFQSQFYNLRRAMNRERPDLWERYLDLSFFLRGELDGRIKVIIRKGHPLDETLESLGITSQPWPDPPSGEEVEKDYQAVESIMEDTITRLFGPGKKS